MILDPRDIWRSQAQPALAERRSLAEPPLRGRRHRRVPRERRPSPRGSFNAARLHADASEHGPWQRDGLAAVLARTQEDAHRVHTGALKPRGEEWPSGVCSSGVLRIVTRRASNGFGRRRARQQHQQPPQQQE